MLRRSVALSLLFVGACGGRAGNSPPGDAGPTDANPPADATLSPDGSAGMDAASPPSACIPGQSVACVGPGGCSTNQVCNGDGSGFGPCNCGPSLDGAVPLCIPGRSVACTGPGGCSSSQVCNSDGSEYGPCDCAPGDASAPVCAPGQSIACSGPGGCISSQACNASGSGYGPCVCSGDGGAALLCIPGQSIACAGEYGCASFQVCDDAGTAYGPCDCPVFDDAGALPDGAVVSSASFGPPAPIEQHVLVPPYVLASDGNDLFWIDENGDVWRDPVAGGGATQLASGASSYTFLYLDATNAYFLASGGITAVPKDGDGSTSTVLIATTDAVTATASGGTAYWMEQQSSSGSGPTQWTELLKSAPLVAGGTVTTLDTLQTAGVDSIGSMAVADSTFFVTESVETLATIPPDGGAPMSLGTACTAILAATGGVYCAGPPIELVAPNGSTTLISSEASYPRGLAADESNVYWTNDVESGSVVAAPLLGGPYVILGYDAMPIAVAVDDDAVYWSDNAGNIERVMKVK